MSTASNLQSLSFQAYNAFKSNANNVAQVNSEVTKVLALATSVANGGDYSCTHTIANFDANTTNPLLFARLLKETLEGKGFLVTVSSTSNYIANGFVTISVTIDWNPEND
jgi:hypothetical protein